MQLTIITPPAAEPVSVTDAKLAARLDGAHWDGIVAIAIQAAREVAEHETGRRFMAQQLRIELEDWPAATTVLPVYRPTAVAISHWDGAAWVALVAGTDYASAALGPGFVVAPALGLSWPDLGEVALGARVRIDATVGVADAADVPAAAVTFIKAMVSVMTADPSLTVMDALGSAVYLPRILDPLRLYR